MKKFTFILAFMLAFAGYSHSQMIEDFEHIPLNIMFGGEDDNSTMTAVANPDQGDANPSPYVIEFFRSQHGVPWGGFWSALPEPVDMTDMKYVHVQVWKPRISPIKFKVEGGPGGTFELESIEPQTLTEEWETITFHFPDADGMYPVIALLPDFEDPLELDDDIVIYFDNIVFSDHAEPGEGNELMVENFSPITMNLMDGGENDDSYFDVVLNPDPNDVNPSHRVGKFFRSQHGVPWGGFWSALPETVDMSEHKYVYVDVWKPRISPIKFKVEGGPGGTFELESMEPQTKINEWETIVFHFPDADGEYPVIAFMPDFEDPLELDEDIIIYFDNIRVGEAPEGDTEYDVDFVWVDFETEGLTNVEGFREVVNVGTVATDIADAGVNGGTIVELDYEVTEELPFTGYRMWAFPSWDVSEYTHIVLHIKAAEAITNARLDLFDTEGIASGDDGISFTYFDIGTDWHEVVIAIEDFELPEGIDNHPDMTVLQLVRLSFEYENTTPHAGTVHIDLVGFNEDTDVSVPAILPLADFAVKVFPNPAREQVTVETLPNSMVTLIDITGNVITQQVSSGPTTSLNLNGLSKGIYLIRVVNGEHARTTKLMVQ